MVRSMAQPKATPSDRPARVRYYDNSNGDEEAVQAQAADSILESPSAAIPIPGENDNDLERGDDMAATLVNDQAGSSSSRIGWRGLASLSLSAFTGEAPSRQSRSDRDR